MLRDDELPPLPDYLSPGTVREYGRAVERAAYELAAQECENRSGPIEIYNRAYPHYLECADAIRALGRQHEHQ